MRKVRPPIRVIVGLEPSPELDALLSVLADEGLETVVAADADTVEESLADVAVGLLVVDPDLFGADAFLRLRSLRDAHERLTLFLVASAPVLDAATQVLGDDRVEFLRKPLSVDDLVEALDRRVSHPAEDTVHEREVLAGIGDSVRVLREARGHTRKDLAQLAGVSASLVSQLERGETSPSIATLVRIARALDVSVKALFERC